jgi:hypothetical protein
MRAAVTLLLFVSHTVAFHVSTFGRRPHLIPQWAKKVKRGELGKVAVDVAPKSPKRSKPSKKSSGTVSPALAEWAASASNDLVKVESPVITSDADTFTPFVEPTNKKSLSSRRAKQSARKEEEKERDQAVLRMLTGLEDKLEKKATLEDILNGIRPLLSIAGGTNLRQLTASAKRVNYRLAWVGGNDSLTYIGTGLHKVPLARMQEVFLTLHGRNRIELLEVIRIIGPFPNVRNILQGDSSVKSSQDNFVEWEIVMDSMIDGTGKEILAGTEDNVRRVKLQVYMADSNAILAVVPPESGGFREDPLEDDGAHALLFVREDDLDAKLEMLRVN